MGRDRAGIVSPAPAPRKGQSRRGRYWDSSPWVRSIAFWATARPSASPTLTSVGKWIPAQMRDWPASSANAFSVWASRGNRELSAAAAPLEKQPCAAG